MNLKLKTKSYNPTLRILITTSLVLIISVFVIGSFYDLKIAEKLVNKESLYGQTFDIFGKIAIIIPLNFIIVGLVYHYVFYKGITKTQGSFIIIIFEILVLFIFLMIESIFFRSNKLLPLQFNALIIIIFDLIISYFWHKNIELVKDKNLVKKIILAIVFVLLIYLSTEILKNVVSRPRPRNVIDGTYEYHAWWQFDWSNAIIGKNKSFPSGHTTSAMSLLAPIFVMNRKSVIVPINFAIALLFAILTAGSRMVLAAHFLTDVTGAMIISIIIFSFLLSIKFKKGKTYE
ncbi:hypothetical protein EELLY_v1c01050 [Entomoplasma ellychniae]|uniref:Phosphatidic acid phosphatase type 2/haloperoxidase domain-containing protein n=1 Tax=Entomoplasma ellychniae TaxID=2114 RepID=A0A8E2QXJ1_9MOLU|nr:phosphatase PAP2 family protein [Entomoplasma ellychniae]PPE04430.1 hypothetical protein EELLY_v1c01050 [Entomoplasma ellychniae]